MGDFKRAFLVCFAFFVFFSAFGLFNFFSYGSVNSGQDFLFHWNRVNGIVDETPYPPLYHAVFSVFSFHVLGFYLANVFLVCVLVPLVLFLVSGRLWSVVVFFCGVSLPHMVLYGATFPQALVLLFFLVYLLFRRSFSLLAVLTALAFFTHHYGLYLFGFVWFVEILLYFFKGNGKRFWAGMLLPSQFRGLDGFVAIVFFQAPLPVLFYGLRGFRGLFELIVFAGSVAMSAFDARALSVAQVLLAIGFGKGFEKKPKSLVFGMALFLVFQLAFYFLDYSGGTWKFIVFN